MKRGLRRALLFIAAVVVYVLFFPAQTGRELMIEASWAVRPAPVLEAVTTPGSEELVPVVVGNRFGFVSEDGQIVYSGVSSGLIAIAPDRFISYNDQSESSVVQAADGSFLHLIDAAGYPQLVEGGTVIVDPDGMTVSRYNSNGQIRWNQMFDSTVTAIDSSADLTVVGLVGGGLSAVRTDGTVLEVDAAAVGLSGVTSAVVVRPDGGSFAAVTGTDEIGTTAQALASIVTVYTIDQERALPVLRREFIREAERTPRLLLSPSGQHLLYTIRTSDGSAVGVIDLERGAETELPLRFPASELLVRSDESTFWVLSRATRQEPSVGFRFPAAIEVHSVNGRRLISSGFAADTVTMRKSGELTVLTVDDRALALRLELR